MSFAKRQQAEKERKQFRRKQMGTKAERTALYRKIHAAQKRIGLSEHDLRLIYKQHGATLKDGKYSKTTLIIDELYDVVAQLNKSTQPPRKKYVKLQNKQVKYAYRLWNDLNRKGVIADASWAAFTAWCSRMLQTELDSEKFNNLSVQQCNMLIQSLKNWESRHEKAA